jgi:hypothetical protein
MNYEGFLTKKYDFEITDSFNNLSYSEIGGYNNVGGYYFWWAPNMTIEEAKEFE